jgi:hypothetical protein
LQSFKGDESLDALSSTPRSVQGKGRTVWSAGYWEVGIWLVFPNEFWLSSLHKEEIQLLHGFCSLHLFMDMGNSGRQGVLRNAVIRGLV